MRITIEIDPSGSATVQSVGGSTGRAADPVAGEPVNAGAVPDELLQLATREPIGPGANRGREGPVLKGPDGVHWPYGMAPTQAIGFAEDVSAGPAPLE